LDKGEEKNNNIICLSDGRFHLEGTMIANPKYNFYQYNPYNKVFEI